MTTKEDGEGMNEFMIRDKIKLTSKALDDHKKECLENDNQALQDFMLWLIGFLDGNISKRGEGKEV
jgi:hypothetical protein